MPYKPLIISYLFPSNDPELISNALSFTHYTLAMLLHLLEHFSNTLASTHNTLATP